MSLFFCRLSAPGGENFMDSKSILDYLFIPLLSLPAVFFLRISAFFTLSPLYFIQILRSSSKSLRFTSPVPRKLSLIFQPATQPTSLLLSQLCVSLSFPSTQHKFFSYFFTIRNLSFTFLLSQPFSLLSLLIFLLMYLSPIIFSSHFYSYAPRLPFAIPSMHAVDFFSSLFRSFFFLFSSCISPF